MFNIDERLKGLPAVKEQVVQLFQSLNQPHLAVPGRQAGTAMAFVLGLRGPSGFAVFVYLYLADSGECAVYVPSSGTVAADKFQGEEAEALGFVESMGFIMDNLNFRGRPVDEQDQMIRTFPVFQREPPSPGTFGGGATAHSVRPPTGRNPSVVSIGKLFSAFSLALAVSSGACVHVPTDKERDQAQAHYDLAVQALVKDPQESFRATGEALKLDPGFAEAWHVKGVLLHTAFGRQEEARAAYLKALQLKEPFSEAHTNLGNLYMDQKRYDDAIHEYEIALNDVLYTAAFIAQGNMGWAFYKKGDVKNAIDRLKASVTMNSKYCLGYLQLGQLYSDRGEAQDSCKYFGKYREACPDQADAYQHEGVCLAKLGDKESAARSFDTCVAKAKVDEVKEHCQKLKEQLPR